jgi:hypothetical protein
VPEVFDEPLPLDAAIEYEDVLMQFQPRRSTSAVDPAVALRDD